MVKFPTPLAPVMENAWGGRIDRRTTVTDCVCRLISAVGSVFGQYKSEPEF